MKAVDVNDYTLLKCDLLQMTRICASNTELLCFMFSLSSLLFIKESISTETKDGIKFPEAMFSYFAMVLLEERTNKCFHRFQNEP
jgi:hypothetical protein